MDASRARPQALTLPAERLAHFAADWLRLWDDPRPVGLAVSGGPDSMALFALAQTVLPGRFAVATVDHGLRAQAAAEAAMVAQVCAAHAVPHATLTLELAPGSAVQERARVARYAALGRWLARAGLAALVTAHHADDQAETMVMRANRGAGLRGLAGMRALATVPGHTAPLLRPLLGWRRAALAEVVAQAGLPVADDPSNRDVRFERVRVRRGLAAADWIDPSGLAASAAHLAEADDALDWAADGVWQRVADTGTALLWDATGVPRALTLRLLKRVIARLGQGPVRGGDLARWHDRLRDGRVATLGGVQGDGRAALWRFAAVPPPRTRPPR